MHVIVPGPDSLSLTLVVGVHRRKHLPLLPFYFATALDLYVQREATAVAAAAADTITLQHLSNEGCSSVESNKQTLQHKHAHRVGVVSIVVH